MKISIVVGKTFNEIQYLYMIKAIRRLDIERNFLI
jgi:hypothetical protein